MSFDAARLLAEIQAEVRDKRASGELPADLERELDRTFAQLAPVESADVDFATIIDKLAGAATVDTKASTSSSRRGVSEIKRAVGKAIEWDLRHMATQVSSLSHGFVRALQLLDQRLGEVERAVPSDVALQLADLAGPSSLPDGPWTEIVVAAMSAVPGRILHAECGDGAMLAALEDAGLDCYGVQPGERAALGAGNLAVDVRADDAFDHVAHLPAGSLGGVILSGCVERLAAPALFGLAEGATRSLVPGGVLAVVSATPGAWVTPRSPVLADLAAGRPLHPETWVAILSRLGLSQPVVTLGPSIDRLAPLDDDNATSVALNASLAKLNDIVFGPSGYSIVASR